MQNVVVGLDKARDVLGAAGAAQRLWNEAERDVGGGQTRGQIGDAAALAGCRAIGIFPYALRKIFPFMIASWSMGGLRMARKRNDVFPLLTIFGGAFVAIFKALSKKSASGAFATAQDHHSKKAVLTGSTANAFAWIKIGDAFQIASRAEYSEMLRELEEFVIEAFDHLKAPKTGVAEPSSDLLYDWEALADDLQAACEDLGDKRLEFGDDTDREDFLNVLVEGQHLAFVLHAAAERRVFPSSLLQDRRRMKGDFRMTYRNAEGRSAMRRQIQAVAWSMVGDRAYLWGLYSVDEALLCFRVDRIEKLADKRTKTVIPREEIARWLRARAET
jgi:hypothetical protein